MAVDISGTGTDNLGMFYTKQLLALAAAYGKALGIPPVTVSYRVFEDSKKLAALQAGRDITVRRYVSAVQWFSDNWPERARWPVDIDRPEPSRDGKAA